MEPVFGQVKFNLGFRRFRLRGVDKADGEWTLVCLVHNIKKIYARIMAKGGELDDLTGELQVAYNPALEKRLLPSRWKGTEEEKLRLSGDLVIAKVGKAILDH